VTTTATALVDSLSLAWRRTGGLLWRPFDAKTWFVLAFAQFLAALPPDLWGGGGGSGSGRDWSRTGRDLESAWERLMAGGLILGLLAFGVLLLLILVLALLWVSSRGKFVFLDDVVHRRALIIHPWREFRREGNSLFLFTIGFFFAACLAVAMAVATVVSTVGLGFLLRGEALKITAVAVIAGSFVGLLFVALAYAAFFLSAFVVPIMHRYRLGAVDAWGRFLGLFRSRPLPFLVVGLVVITAFAVFGIWALMFGFMTCCIGFVLLMTPYLSNVVLLPLTVLYRSFTLEFLAQFDGDLLPARAEGQ
jgi:hypothetical protein